MLTPEPLRYFAGRMTTLGYLLDCCNFEFLCVLLAAHTFSSCPTLWLRSVYDSRGDSVRLQVSLYALVVGSAVRSLAQYEKLRMERLHNRLEEARRVDLDRSSDGARYIT